MPVCGGVDWFLDQRVHIDRFEPWQLPEAHFQWKGSSGAKQRKSLALASVSECVGHGVQPRLEVAHAPLQLRHPYTPAGLVPCTGGDACARTKRI